MLPLRGAGDSRWINFAGRRLSEQFGQVTTSLGLAAWETDRGADASPAVILDCETPHLTDLDLSILFGIAYRVYVETRREGIAVLVDDDFIAL